MFRNSIECILWYLLDINSRLYFLMILSSFSSSLNTCFHNLLSMFLNFWKISVVLSNASWFYFFIVMSGTTIPIAGIAYEQRIVSYLSPQIHRSRCKYFFCSSGNLSVYLFAHDDDWADHISSYGIANKRSNSYLDEGQSLSCFYIKA